MNDPIKELHREMEAIESAARAIPGGKDVAEAIMRAASIDTEALVARGEAIGLSRETVEGWASVTALVVPRDLDGMTTAEVARLHLSYGRGNNEKVDGEFWRRNPALHGMQVAIWALQDAGENGAVSVLNRRYHAAVRAIAGS